FGKISCRSWSRNRESNLRSTSFSRLLPICEMKRAIFLLFLTAAIAFGQDFDVIIRSGAVYDGTGSEAQHVDLAIKGDRIAGLGDFSKASAKTIVNANGLAVAPGFINMLSWSTESLIQDGRSQSELRQGVTTEIMGEGES